MRLIMLGRSQIVVLFLLSSVFSFLVLYEINFTAVQTCRQHRAILYGKLRVPSFRGGVYGKTDVNISLETMLDGSLTLLMLGENQKLKNTSTCKNLYR